MGSQRAKITRATAINPWPEEICSFQVPQLHYPCWAAPVLSNKRLFLRSEDKLVCHSLAK